jgi:DNA primase small subunit
VNPQKATAYSLFLCLGWICDTRARKLSHDQRAAIVDFLSVYMGKEKKVVLTSGQLHPSLQRAYEQLLPFFEELLDTQGWLATSDKMEKMLEYFEPAVREDFRFDDEDASGSQKWDELRGKVQAWLNKNSTKKNALYTNVKTALIRIVFSHVYPRLDVNVSKHLNHLLKSPFCVHPKTGLICIPFDPFPQPDQEGEEGEKDEEWASYGLELDRVPVSIRKQAISG